MNTVYIVYRINIEFKDKIIQSLYSNEIEALRECNYWNSQTTSFIYYVEQQEVLELFEV
jgi:hypothetical protein